ncbi:hypothetical protein K6U20_07615 [Vibrio fluvialis]|uniref:hypothetical protein n=1 Tax=Vibrio fluvialis TaxID=676 RepID=UPI001F1C6BA3|nr:hypothetical protein [Vibrio fluvialis]ELO1773916.1 hypothetical protein [Vibrio fluvialis]ELO1776618.1 hypothetical protein [Vibrio fluvialis]MCE7582912.1 hypothetical protein [Vibrio fluvialis]MCG6404485.1 hypothetical protein [Vibrio fluvialis]
MHNNYHFESPILSIVLIGGFSPVNITRDCLLRYELISSEDYDNARNILLNQGTSRFELPWAIVTVNTIKDGTEAKLSVALTDPGSYALFSDLVMSLCDAFATTTVNALGINFHSKVTHFKLEDWHDFGHKLAPKQFWRKAFAPGRDDLHVGLKTIAIKFDSLLESVAPLTPDDDQTELNVSVKPLSKYEDQTFDTEVMFNYHFPILESLGMEMAKHTLSVYMDDLNAGSNNLFTRLVEEE